jgi:hypothetical protein
MARGTSVAARARVWLRAVTSLCVVFVGTGVSACSSTVDEPAWSTVCPQTEPSAGTPCSTGGTVCEYPNGALQFDPACSSIVKCTDVGLEDAPNTTWVSVQFGLFGVGSMCQPDGPNPSSCPATFAELANGADAGSASFCLYSNGACSDGYSCNTPADLPGPANWYCTAASATCPFPRPRLGSPCTANQGCEYADDPAFGEYSQSCVDGAWQGGYYPSCF